MPNTQLMLFAILIGAALFLVVMATSVHIAILSGILAILALLLSFVAFLTKNYIYLFNAVVNKKGKNLVLNSREAFTLSPTDNAIVRREGGTTYASAFVKVPIYKSGSEMSENEKLEISRLFGRILTLSKAPIKLSAQLSVVNKDEYILKLRGMLNQAEERYREAQAGGGNDAEIAIGRVRGEVMMWKNIMDSVSSSQSRSLVAYAMVTAVGGTEEEASNIAFQRAEELASGISTILGTVAYVVTGREMLNFIEPEYMIPVETVSERLMKKTSGVQ